MQNDSSDDSGDEGTFDAYSPEMQQYIEDWKQLDPEIARNPTLLEHALYVAIREAQRNAKGVFQERFMKERRKRQRLQELKQECVRLQNQMHDQEQKRLQEARSRLSRSIPIVVSIMPDDAHMTSEEPSNDEISIENELCVGMSRTPGKCTCQGFEMPLSSCRSCSKARHREIEKASANRKKCIVGQSL